MLNTVEGRKRLATRFSNARHNKSCPKAVLDRYAKNKSNKSAVRKMMLDWLQDKSWGWLLQIIQWERKLLEAEEQQDEWLIESQIDQMFGYNYEFSKKLIAAAKAAGRSRPHPLVATETQYKITAKDLEVLAALRVVAVGIVTQNIETISYSGVQGAVGGRGGAKIGKLGLVCDC